MKLLIMLSLLVLVFVPTNAFGLGQVAGIPSFDLLPGETASFQWGIYSEEDKEITLTISATGQGKELLEFVDTITLPDKKTHYVDVTVKIPHDYPLDTFVEPKISALQRGEEGSAIVINVAVTKTVQIAVGDITEEEKKNIQDQKELANAKAQQDAIDARNAALSAAANKNTINNKDDLTNKAFTIAPKETKTVSEDVICGQGMEIVDGYCVLSSSVQSSEGGGCLIATATYGTELAPQVQFLREIRDNTVLSTASGTSFMTGFNQLYYSFSPTIADMERENPMFQEAVRAFITPMISTLSIMTLADSGSEVEVLGLGISVIVLNIGMYVGIPLFGIYRVQKLLKSR